MPLVTISSDGEFTVSGLGGGVNGDNNKVGITSSDTTPGFLSDKITAGSGLQFSVQNVGSNESYQLNITNINGELVSYTPVNLGNWQSGDPGDLDDALNEIALRLKTIETEGYIAPDASIVTYSPGQLVNWLGQDPPYVNAALDLAISRIRGLELASVDLGDVSYTALAPGNWDGGVSPADAEAAVDQLADRLSSAEAAGADGRGKVSATDSTADYLQNKTTGAGGLSITRQNAGGNEVLQFEVTSLASDRVAYAPGTIGDWNGGDPGNIDDAMDQAISRVKALEAAGTPAATSVLYTPTTGADWIDPDPSDVGVALDKLAARQTASFVTEGLVYLDATDTTPERLADKLVFGDFLTGTYSGLANARRLTLDVAGVTATATVYTPQFPSNYSPSVATTKAALDQLIDRLITVENSVSASAASDIDYTPATSVNWDATIPSLVSEALDQAGGRVRSIETRLDYAPNLLSDWGNSDPGDFADALDQIASRITSIETGGAAQFDYTPAVVGNWDAGDPGTIADAMDEVVARIVGVEGVVGGDASGIVYSANDATDWSGNVSPATVASALDQAGLRIQALEDGDGGTPGGGSTEGYLFQDVLIEEAITVPAGFQMIVSEELEIGAAGSIDVLGELVVVGSNEGIDLRETNGWNGIVPPTHEEAIQQLAERLLLAEEVVEAIEIRGSKIEPYAIPDAGINYDPTYSDEFDDGLFNTAQWGRNPNFAPYMTEANGGLTINVGASDDLFGYSVVSAYQTLPYAQATIETVFHPHFYMGNDSDADKTDKGFFAGIYFRMGSNQWFYDLYWFGAFFSSNQFSLGFLVQDGTLSSTLINLASLNNVFARSFTSDTMPALPSSIYLRVSKNTDNSATFSASYDGVSWLYLHKWDYAINGESPNSMNAVGIGVSYDLPSIDNAIKQGGTFGFFRISNTVREYNAPMLGRKINIIER